MSLREEEEEEERSLVGNLNGFHIAWILGKKKKRVYLLNVNPSNI